MSFTHSIMFHHFHDKKHLSAQGSLSSTDFSEMLDWLASRYNLIGANEYLYKFENSVLNAKDICLSFDDGLLCQYDVAIPILGERDLDAFFFVYSSAFKNEPDNLEIFRYFRVNGFAKIDDFYDQFFALTIEHSKINFAKHHERYQNLGYLSAFPFYSENDKWFRYLRDQVLGPENYKKLMFQLMSMNSFSPKNYIEDLWVSEAQLKDISDRGHIVGLHSFSHPTQMSRLSYQEQSDEFHKNLDHISGIVGSVVSMSHPCGDFNQSTLTILEELGIRIGFLSSLKETKIKSKFEIPRNDHTNIYNAMRK